MIYNGLLDQVHTRTATQWLLISKIHLQTELQVRQEIFTRVFSHRLQLLSQRS